MDNQLDIMLENADSEFITLTYDDHSLVSHPEQLSADCTDMSKYPNICIMYCYLIMYLKQLH